MLEDKWCVYDVKSADSGCSGVHLQIVCRVSVGTVSGGFMCIGCAFCLGCDSCVQCSQLTVVFSAAN
jgi:hypothetical protein